MKINLIILSILLLSGTDIIQPTLAQKTLNYVTIDNFMPYTWQENGQAKGIDVDIVKSLCQRLQIKCNVSFRPFKRAMVELQGGEKDFAAGLMREPEREKFVHFLYPVHYSTYHLFVKKGHEFPFKTLKDLYGKKVGKNRGWSMGEDFDKAVAEGHIRLSETKDVTANLKMLMVGRIDGFAGQTTSTRIEIKKLGMSGEVVSLPRLLRKPIPAYLVVSKAAEVTNKQQLIQKLTHTLKEMHEDGTVERIHSNYLK